MQPKYIGIVDVHRILLGYGVVFGSPDNRIDWILGTPNLTSADDGADRDLRTARTDGRRKRGADAGSKDDPSAHELAAEC